MSKRPYNVADVMTKSVVAVAPGAGFKEIVEAVARWKGEVHDGTLIPVAARLAQGVEGVVDVRCELTAAESPSRGRR